jgi:O-antigen/teichoic acid export membrane protein
MLSFTALISADVILVKHFFSPIEAGYYSIAQMVGKIAFYLPSALAIVILPKSTRAYVTDGSDLKLLYKSLILAAICCFSITAVSFLFPKAILRALTGEVNLVSVELVGLFSLAMSFYAFTWIVVNYLLGMHNTKIALPILLLAVLEGVVIYNCHPTLKVVIYNLLGFSVISFFASFIIAKSTKSNG